MSTASAIRSPTPGLSAGLRPRHRRPTAPGTERRRATVLFVDVEGSMELCGSVELEEWWSAIDTLFQVLCEGVHAHGGWVASFTGDGLQAVFDGCVSDEGEHARRACAAALWIRAAAAGPGAELWHAHGLKLSIRTGIHSGEILVGMIGRRDDGHRTATGYAVGLAKRIEGLATPGEAWVSERTASLAYDMEFCDQGTFAVKGAPEPVRVYELRTARAS